MDSAKQEQEQEQEFSKGMLPCLQFLLPVSLVFLVLLSSCIFFPSVDRKALLLLCNVILLFVIKQSIADAGSGCSLRETAAAAAEWFGIPPAGTEEEDAVAAAEDGEEEESSSSVIGDDKGSAENDELEEKSEAYIAKMKKLWMMEALHSASVKSE